MLDPNLVLAAIVTALQAIPELVAEMGGDSTNIAGHYYAYGTENSLIQRIYAMKSPSVLVSYMDLLGGNFDGSTVWKHRIEVYIRPGNNAMGAGSPAANPPHLWWLMMNRPVTGLGTTQNLRYLPLLNGSLQIPDTPTLLHRTDENGADFFVGSIAWPEAGDD